MAETMTEIAKTTPSVPAEALRPEGLPIHAGGVGAAMESWKLACSMGKAYAQQPEGMVPKNYAGNPGILHRGVQHGHPHGGRPAVCDAEPVCGQRQPYLERQEL